MDLLFSKYANPFALLDELILHGQFFDWVLEFVNGENERQLWDVWIHKVFDRSFDDFKRSIGATRLDQSDEKELETTIMNSKSLLNEFIPTKG